MPPLMEFFGKRETTNAMQPTVVDVIPETGPWPVPAVVVTGVLLFCVLCLGLWLRDATQYCKSTIVSLNSLRSIHRQTCERETQREETISRLRGNIDNLNDYIYQLFEVNTGHEDLIIALKSKLLNAGAVEAGVTQNDGRAAELDISQGGRASPLYEDPFVVGANSDEEDDEDAEEVVCNLGVQTKVEAIEVREAEVAYFGQAVVRNTAVRNQSFHIPSQRSLSDELADLTEDEDEDDVEDPAGDCSGHVEAEEPPDSSSDGDCKLTGETSASRDSEERSAPSTGEHEAIRVSLPKQ